MTQKTNKSKATSDQARKIAQKAKGGSGNAKSGKAKSATPKSRGQRSNGGWIVLYAGIGAVAVVLLVFAVMSNRGQREEKSKGQYGSPTVAGEALPAQSGNQGAADVAIGKVAPEVTGSDFDGKEIKIAPDGKGKLVVMLAHWCPHCRNEVPKLVDLFKTQGDKLGIGKDVEVIGVSTLASPTRANWPPQDWLKAEGWDEPILVDSEASQVFDAYAKGMGTPAIVVLDGDNKVLYRVSGELPPEQWAELIKMAKTGKSGTGGGSGGSGSTTTTAPATAPTTTAPAG